MNDSRLTIDTRRPRISALAGGLASAAAAGVFFGWPIAFYGLPLILGSLLAAGWPRVGSGLIWFGAIWQSFWVLPLAIALSNPLQASAPMVHVVAIPAAASLLWLDLELLIVVIKKHQTAPTTIKA